MGTPLAPHVRGVWRQKAEGAHGLASDTAVLDCRDGVVRTTRPTEAPLSEALTIAWRLDAGRSNKKPPPLGPSGRKKGV